MSSPTFNEGDAHPLGLTKDTISRYALERNQTHHVPPLCSFALSTRCSYFARARFRPRTQADCPLTVASTVPRCGTPPVARPPSHSHHILPCYGGRGFFYLGNAGGPASGLGDATTLDFTPSLATRSEARAATTEAILSFYARIRPPFPCQREIDLAILELN